MLIYNVELYPGKGGQLARAAGVSAKIVRRFKLNLKNSFVGIKLPSGQIKFILSICMATIGQVSNIWHGLEKWGKAGRAMKLGHRPSVRGVAMNPVDHPHGGGEGKTSGGRPSVSKWGFLTKGKKTKKFCKKRKEIKIIKRIQKIFQ